MYEYLRDHPEAVVTVLGHTDTKGSAGNNLKVSAWRAENVYLLLKGDLEGWASHCAEHAEDVDVDKALAWVGTDRGWDCIPTSASKLKAATSAFRRAHVEAHPGSSFGEGPFDERDWLCIARLYEQAIADLLFIPHSVFLQRQARTRFSTPAFIACGESYPISELTKNGFACEDNRRVDVVFCDPADDQLLPKDPDERSALLYGGLLKPEHLEVGAERFSRIRVRRKGGEACEHAVISLRREDGASRVLSCNSSGWARFRAMKSARFQVDSIGSVGPAQPVEIQTVSGEED